MIETGERLLPSERTGYCDGGGGQFSTDRGTIDLSAPPMNPGGEVRTHLGVPFIVLRPRPTDFLFTQAAALPRFQKT